MKAESFNRAERMEIGGGEAQERRKSGVVFPEGRCRAGQGCVCGGAGSLFAFGGGSGYHFHPCPSRPLHEYTPHTLQVPKWPQRL